MMSLYTQYKELLLSYEKRFSFLKERLLYAVTLNQKLDEFGILFDSNNDGSHLACWITAINQFDRYLKGEE